MPKSRRREGFSSEACKLAAAGYLSVLIRAGAVAIAAACFGNLPTAVPGRRSPAFRRLARPLPFPAWILKVAPRLASEEGRGEDKRRTSSTSRRKRRVRKEGGGVPSTGPGVPAYVEGHLACEVFSKPCFYKPRELANPSTMQDKKADREETFTELTTVEEALQQFNGSCGKLAEAIGALSTQIEEYYEQRVTVEDLLDEAGVVAISGSNDFRAYENQQVLELPTLKGMAPDEARPSEQTRARNLCICMGSSGSGKTFFCLKFLTRFRVPSGMRKVGIYLHASSAVVRGSGPDKVNVAGLVESLRGAISAREDFRKRGMQVGKKLKMHACVIFDEAGDLGLDGWFESVENLKTLCQGEEDESDDDEEEGTAHQGSTDKEEYSVTKQWNKLMEELREGVIIKFLHTRSGQSEVKVPVVQGQAQMSAGMPPLLLS